MGPGGGFRRRWKAKLVVRYVVEFVEWPASSPAALRGVLGDECAGSRVRRRRREPELILRAGIVRGIMDEINLDVLSRPYWSPITRRSSIGAGQGRIFWLAVWGQHRDLPDLP